MTHQHEPEAEHAERMRLLNAAIVRLHGLSVEQLREANLLLTTVSLRRPGVATTKAKPPKDSGAAA